MYFAAKIFPGNSLLVYILHSLVYQDYEIHLVYSAFLYHGLQTFIIWIYIVYLYHSLSIL